MHRNVIALVVAAGMWIAAAALAPDVSMRIVAAIPAALLIALAVADAIDLRRRPCAGIGPEAADSSRASREAAAGALRGR